MLPPPSCHPPPRMRPCQGDPVEAAGVGGAGQGREAAFTSAVLFSEETQAWFERRRHTTGRSELPPSRMSLLLNQETQKPPRVMRSGCTWTPPPDPRPRDLLLQGPLIVVQLSTLEMEEVTLNKLSAMLCPISSGFQFKWGVGEMGAGEGENLSVIFFFPAWKRK